MNPLAAAALGGVLGWGLLRVLYPEDPSYSKAFGGPKIPFLPVFALGAASVALAAPHLRDVSLLERGALYGAGATALELGACALDRTYDEQPRWNYGQRGTPRDLVGCVDLKHSLAWAGLALLFEPVVR